MTSESPEQLIAKVVEQNSLMVKLMSDYMAAVDHELSQLWEYILSRK